MRNALLFTFLLATLSGPLFAGDADKVIPSFLVVSSEEDRSLEKNESVFEFEIVNPELRGSSSEVSASWNGNLFTFTPDENGKYELKVAPGIYTFQFYYPYLEETGMSYAEIYSPETTIEAGYRTNVQLRFQNSEVYIISDKPVIYLYPQEDQPVSVTVAPKKPFTFTYPAYENGWKGTAHPDGSMTIAGKNYPYLFWESENVFRPGMIDASKGFIVERENTIAFLEEQLTAMGLNDREQADFITYWGPRMVANGLNYVHFLFNDDVNQLADLGIEPQPEHLFRVYMLWWEVPSEFVYDVGPQVMQSVDRSGFYAIEWGGSEVPSEEKAFVQTILQLEREAFKCPGGAEAHFQ